MERKYQDLGLVAGANLKRLMKENQLTQEDFAEAFCADDRTVRRWISQGINNITLIGEIADFFNVSITDILGLTE